MQKERTCRRFGTLTSYRTRANKNVQTLGANEPELISVCRTNHSLRSAAVLNAFQLELTTYTRTTSHGHAVLLEFYS